MATPDDIHMTRALALADRALGTTWPNPAVGCVIVSGQDVVGEAATAPRGRPHAEVRALDLAGPRAAGSTVYVTLEPCAHQGETGPCAEALVKARVARVVVAMEDPDPRVSGRGLEILRKAGITVDLGLGAAEAARITQGFVSRVALGRPMVTLKLAQSLDGRIALASGASRWITGGVARAYVHALRARCDGILIGAGTARADDPMLDVREGITTPRPPVRIVADSQLTLSLGSRLVQSAKSQPLWLLHVPGAPPARAAQLAAAGVVLLSVPAAAKGRVDMAAALQMLGARGLTSVLCEGGGTLAASLIAASRVDHLLTILSGKIIGGDGQASIGPLGALDLGSVPQMELVDTSILGPDIALSWRKSTP